MVACEPEVDARTLPTPKDASAMWSLQQVGDFPFPQAEGKWMEEALGVGKTFAGNLYRRARGKGRARALFNVFLLE